MRRLLITASLLLMTAAPFAAEDLCTSLPTALPDLSRWQLITGDVTSTQMRVIYHFYVNPQRGAMYQVMHYRVHPFAWSPSAAGRAAPTEKVVWSEHPGRGHLRCFERVLASDTMPAHWQEMTHATPAYDQEMRTVIRILALHRAVRLGPGQ